MVGAGVAQLVELQPSKLDVAGSNPVARSISRGAGIVRVGLPEGHAHVAQSVERVLGKDEVTSSILVIGSMILPISATDRRFLRFWTGRVAERLMAADCKSAAPCGLRRFESSPVHQGFENLRIGGFENWLRAGGRRCKFAPRGNSQVLKSR